MLRNMSEIRATSDCLESIMISFEIEPQKMIKENKIQLKYNQLEIQTLKHLFVQTCVHFDKETQWYTYACGTVKFYNFKHIVIYRLVKVLLYQSLKLF